LLVLKDKNETKICSIIILHKGLSDFIKKGYGGLNSSISGSFFKKYFIESLIVNEPPLYRLNVEK
jgi:hypothetical protein